ncbi:Uncharacterised protein [Shigella sonnei]|nr:Uncharacterised protein [Shigella sonnei]CSF42167.1 Uncharacterised protein [Shigella sonnei]CSF73593.1 Uncharacterised protein [Shigella sonnei]CSG15726.1 Uncharacterised protein [Shigella sonnei]CSG44469.1 Uncharacterised protein [Shigella sonnei]
MPALGHFDCGLPFSTARIQHTQFLRTHFRQHAIEILPQNSLSKLPFGGAVNVTGKLFRNIIKIAILHCFLHRLAKTFSDKDAILSQPRRE